MKIQFDKDRGARKDCFGNFSVIEKTFRRLDNDSRCSALTKKKCTGCKFYKNVNQVRLEFEKYGYPTDN